MPSLVRIAPELPVDDVKAALQEYEEKLGFHVSLTLPSGDYAIVERGDVALHLFQGEASQHWPGSVHVFTAGLDELLAELQSRGARVTQGIVRHPWGNRDFRVADAYGNTLKFTEPLDE
jgi:uncharacterized glyoxalase superfamily protein PhnB